MLGGWYGAKITVLRGYMTNTDAPDYAKAHADEFPAGEAQKVADITANVRRKFAQGGTWQNRWPTEVDVYEVRVGALQGGMTRGIGRGGPVARPPGVSLPAHRFPGGFLLVPLGLMVAVSFWERVGLFVRPAFVLTSYLAFFDGVRFTVLERSLLVSLEATVLSLVIAYPIAYFLAFKARPGTARLVLLLFTVPFLVNYIIRTFAWTVPPRPHRPGQRASHVVRRHRRARSTGCSTAISPSSSG